MTKKRKVCCLEVLKLRNDVRIFARVLLNCKFVHSAQKSQIETKHPIHCLIIFLQNETLTQVIENCLLQIGS